VSEPSIIVENMGLCYRARPILRDVHLTVPTGSVTAIVGPSGCGKSSFLTCLNRLIDLEPTAKVSGRISVAGVDVRTPGVDLRALRRQVGTIFQKPTPFPCAITTNIELAIAGQGMRDHRARAAIVKEVLCGVALWDEVHDRLHERATTLSGGQQQRLCIARALALRPDILLMDEPCSALDPLATQAVEELIRSLAGRYTVLVVTHNLAQARRIADQTAVFWLRDGVGTCIERGRTEQIFTAPREEETRRYVAGEAG
jgi:phosphate transport system ATP-binding protein